MANIYIQTAFFAAWGSSINSVAYGAAGSGALGGGNKFCGAGHKGTGVTNNIVGNNTFLFLLVVFETSLIAGEDPRCSDVFSQIVVELDKETYGTDT